MSKTNLLYLGKNTDLIKNIESRDDYELSVYHNPFHVYNDIVNGQVSPDIILCESSLNCNSGQNIYDQFQKNAATRNIPFCLVSPPYNLINSKRIKKSGIADIFADPFDINEKHNVIQAIIEVKNLELTSGKNQRYLGTPFAKRLFDIVVASCIILAISPIILIVGILIKLESKGPVFYFSKRVGSGYQIFKFYKMRSMYVDADQRLKDLNHLNQYETQEEVISESFDELEAKQDDSPTLFTDHDKITEREFVRKSLEETERAFVKIPNDPRITKVGKFIRNSSIDELPQLFNVLIGDMSIVGNRPLPLYEAEKLTTDEWAERFLAPAGITGLWQVRNRGKAGKMSSSERKSLDNEYARNYSLAFDIKLIFQTVPALFQKENV